MSNGVQVERFSHHEVVKGTSVRPIHPSEREHWDFLIRQHHYLGFRSLVGRSLRYVAEFKGCWLALLGWHAAALKCKARDRWIGWSPIIRHQRLHLIANNSRFLILPSLRIKNLASRILSLNLKRLSFDWQAIHGHQVYLAETFVETPRFTGVCYRAANWQSVGETKGFSRSGGRYSQHGRPKEILLFPLHPHTCERLSAVNPHPSWRFPMQNCTLNTKQMETLFLRLHRLPDCRRPRGVRHKFSTVLTIAIAALLAGARGYTAIAEWAQRLNQNQLRRLRARYDEKTKCFIPPSEPTIRRVLQSANVEVVERCLGQWIVDASRDEAIAVDGKTMKGARKSSGAKVHLLSAFLHSQALTVNQLDVDEKTNEIPMLSALLDPLNIKGNVVTADALHTQRSTARYLVKEKHADYLFIVKENQPTLLEDIKFLDDKDFSPSVPNC